MQAAVDAATAGDTVLVSRGTYRETVNVPASKHGLTLKGATGNAEDVVITYDNASGTPKPGGGTYGTAGSATATFSANDITVTGVTVENTWERSAHPDVRDTQAVAVNASGDRQKYVDSRFIGHQDTVLNWAPSATGQYRQYFRHCFIAGDVDFVFGNATAVYDQVNITLRDRGAAAGGHNGYLAAPNTYAAKPYGILITDSTISSPARPGTYYLGRPWHPGPSAVGQLVIRNTSLPAAVKTEGPWTDMGASPGSPPGSPSTPTPAPAPEPERTVPSSPRTGPQPTPPAPTWPAPTTGTRRTDGRHRADQARANRSARTNARTDCYAPAPA